MSNGQVVHPKGICYCIPAVLREKEISKHRKSKIKKRRASKHMYPGILLSHKKDEILTFGTTRMVLENMLSK